MNRRLFVIGNGFDLHHGISSRYSDFAAYLEKVDPEAFRIASDYVVPDRDLWNHLEERLAEIDVDQIEDHASNFLVSYGADDWSDAYHHDYEYEIDQICQAISGKLRYHFSDWVRQLKIPQHPPSKVRCIDPNDVFLNFNYTPTLQRVYGVPKSHILHIHGSSLDTTDDIILGHGWDRRSSELLSRLINEDTDVRVGGGYKLIDDLLGATFKPTREIISRNDAFFSSLSSINEVYVLGHSLAMVDEPYFHALLEQTPATATWTVSYHSDVVATRIAAEKIGIAPERLLLRPLREL